MLTRVVFTCVLKVIRICLGFALLSYAIDLKTSRHFFIQSEVKPKGIVSRLHTFSRALRQLHVFALSSDWFRGLSVLFVIGQRIYFGFGFTTLN